MRFVLVLLRARASKTTARKSSLKTRRFESILRPQFWGYATLPSRFRFRIVVEIGSCALDYDREKIASDHLEWAGRVIGNIVCGDDRAVGSEPLGGGSDLVEFRQRLSGRGA